MLSYVDSEIDEVKMDHLNFVKIYNKQWGPNQNVAIVDLADKNVYSDNLETDPNLHSLLTSDVVH